jgi:hypothetical protein
MRLPTPHSVRCCLLAAPSVMNVHRLDERRPHDVSATRYQGQPFRHPLVKVPGGDGGGGAPEELADLGDGEPGVLELGGVGVAEPVGVDALVDAVPHCQQTNDAKHYRGFTALAYVAGTATGSDGKQYDLEADMRAMEGAYVAEDGTRQRGLFAFI